MHERDLHRKQMTLELSYRTLQQALKRWEKAFVFEEEVISAGMGEAFKDAARDSLVRRFEACYEVFWGFAKAYVHVRHNIITMNDPQVVFRELLAQKICSFEESEVLIDMNESRCEVRHGYSLEAVTELLPFLKGYYIVISAITNRCTVP